MADTDTLKNLEILKRKIDDVNRPIILFTGAGFSFEAKNAQGIMLPLGKGLKEMFLKEFEGIEKNTKEAEEYDGNQLSEIYDYLVEKYGNAHMEAYLKKVFSNCIPEEHHKKIIRFPWAKIYTVNIDDLLERTADQVFSPGYLQLVNAPHLKADELKSGIPYIKLHGCINNFSGGFVFGKSEYAAKTAENNDRRYGDLTYDLGQYDFVFIGTAMDESDIDFYLELHGNCKTAQGNMFFIDPSPNRLKSQRIVKAGGHIIKMTTKEFAEWLSPHTDSRPKRTDKNNKVEAFSRNYLHINHELSKTSDKSQKQTGLYFGRKVTWQDIREGYDFIYDNEKDIVDVIDARLHSTSENLMISLISPMMCSKSVTLKRVGQMLVSLGFQVYEFVGYTFNPRNFRAQISKVSGDVIVLLVDNANYRYREIAQLIKDFPKDKRLVVVATSRSYEHFTRHYSVSGLPGYVLFDLWPMGMDDAERKERAEIAVATLEEKSLIGKLQTLDHDERVNFFIHKGPVADALWELNGSREFNSRFRAEFISLQTINNKASEKEKQDIQEILEILVGLSIFDKADLPEIPRALLTLWKPKADTTYSMRLSDFVIRHKRGAISLRNGYMSGKFLENSTKEMRVKILKGIFKALNRFLDTPLSYWNEIQAKLMKTNFLIDQLNLSSKDVRDVYEFVRPIYDNDHCYLIQLALVEQKLGNYDLAKNFLERAEQLAPNSYNVRNAMARNYLLEASSNRECKEIDAIHNYKTGRQMMLKLIGDKEDAQIRAYSVHALIFETLKYWKRFNIIPVQKEFNELVGLLSHIQTKPDNDPLYGELYNRMKTFAERNRLKMPIQRFNSFSDLGKLLKAQDRSRLLKEDSLG